MHPWLKQVCLSVLIGLLLFSPSAPAARAERGPAPARPHAAAVAPVMVNPGFECAQGYVEQPGIDGLVPTGWTAAYLFGQPRLNSTRIEFVGACEEDGFVERLEGQDSLAFLAQDIETPPEPGKPFDAVVYQQVAVTPGTAYSLSGWMVSLCGGSVTPSDCPQGYYIAKMVGIDPAGGTDALAEGVVWVEDLRNFTESRWANLRLGTTAQSSILTVFARIRSPFRWHGAIAFVDAFSLVRAPTAHFIDLPATVHEMQTTIRWDGSQSPDIAAIPGGTYQLLFDLQYRRAGQEDWSDWLTGQPAGQALFTADAICASQTYEFRIRARSEQPAGSHGASPNHRYPGAWSQPASVAFLKDTPCKPVAFLPLVLK